MKILVTGSNGFIGQNIAKYLSKNHEVLGYDRVDGLLPDIQGFDWVIHLGANSSTTERNVDKIMFQNYEFSQNLFNLCKIHNVNFQYASSASVYGDTYHFKEDGVCQPQSPYAWTKYLFDRWVYQQSFDITVQGFRYFNVYGDYELHKGSQASPVTKFTKQAKQYGQIKIFENSDKYERDFICASDICKIHEIFFKKKECGVYNIGTGVPVSFQKIAEAIALKHKAKIIEIPMPDELKGQYQEYTRANIEKLLSTIGNFDFTTPFDYINK